MRRFKVALRFLPDGRLNRVYDPETKTVVYVSYRCPSLRISRIILLPSASVASPRALGRPLDGAPRGPSTRLNKGDDDNKSRFKTTTCAVHIDEEEAP